jgi:hypothetical protein
VPRDFQLKAFALRQRGKVFPGFFDQQFRTFPVLRSRSAIRNFDASGRSVRPNEELEFVAAIDEYVFPS